MKNQKTLSGGLETLFKGHRLAGTPVTQGPTGEMGYFEDSKVGGVFIQVSDSVVVGMHRTALEMLKADDIVDLGDGTYRIDLNPARAHVRMTAEELNHFLSLRREQGATSDAPAFIGAAMPVGTAQAASQAKAEPAPKAAAAKAGKAAKGGRKAKADATAAETAPKAGKAPKAPKAGKGASAPVSLDEKRKGRQAKAGKAQQPAQAQNELPGLTEQEPVREAARSSSNVQRLREPMPAEGGRTATAKPGGRRKKAAPGRRQGLGPLDGPRPGQARRQGHPRQGGGHGRGRHAAGGRSQARRHAGQGQGQDGQGRPGGEGPDGARRRQGQGPHRLDRPRPRRDRAGRAGDRRPRQRHGREGVGAQVILAAGRPLPRRELLQLVQNDLGRPVRARTPSRTSPPSSTRTRTRASGS